MEISSVRWLTELGMEDPTFIHQCQMNSFDEFTTQQIAAALGGDGFQHSFSSESHSSYPTFNSISTTTATLSGSSMEASQTREERPTKQIKISTPEASSSPNILSFGNSTYPTNHSHHLFGNLASTVKPKDEALSPGKMIFPSDVLISQASYLNQNYASKSGQGIKRANPVTRPSSHTQDHIIAERKRREKLSQRFIALSALVPGLKKMDKASVLGDSIKYMEQLQERVKTLEEQAVKKTVESVIFVRKSQISGDDDSSSSDENFGDVSDVPLPEIEARVSDKNVLIRIHCEKSKGVVVKTLAEIEKLHLIVVNSSVMPFGSSYLDITVVARMDVDFCMEVKDLVRHLRSAFRRFM